MSFQISGLDPAPFRHLYGLSDDALAREGARRMIVDSAPGFPDRIELRDLAVGERVILLNYTHQPADTPFRSAHAIFVREGAETAHVAIDEIPDVLRRRTISLRAFDAAGEMIDAALCEGQALAPAILRMLADPWADYLHAHYATRGCYAALIERA